ncbi:MAG: hypothetical protein ABIN80_12865 [Dyadobacter sp.]|uniref:hypothetical protein n=1 Tax=Dyadobacter sp. TaxID=1914288 RepID=UPI00326489F5
MTPILLDRTKINDARWDQLISSSKQCVLYAHTFYLDIVCGGWQALVWPDQSSYQIVMPLPVRIKWGKSIVFQPLFCQYLGLFSMDSLTEADFLAFTRSLSNHFSYISCYHFNPENFNTLSKIKDQLAEFTFVTYHTHWLSLDKPYRQIGASYSADRRVNVSRSKKEGWAFELSIEVETLIELFEANHSELIAGGVNQNAYGMLKKLFVAAESTGIAELWYAKKENVIHSGILLVRYAGRVIYLFNASDPVGRKGNARSGMLDMYFLQHAGEAFIFDFESPEVDQISGFYKSFGSQAIPYLKVSKNRLWFPFRQIQHWRVSYFLKPNQVFAQALIRFKVHFKRADF